jgi:hypothetical protein
LTGGILDAGRIDASASETGSCLCASPQHRRQSADNDNRTHTFPYTRPLGHKTEFAKQHLMMQHFSSHPFSGSYSKKNG